MQGYVVAVSVIAAGCVFAVLAYLALRIFKKNGGRNNSDAETTGLCPPRIILTSDSPGQSKKRLYSPARERAASKDREEKLAKIKKKEKRREIKSLWLPKKKTSLPMMQATMVQPAVPEQNKEQGGRGRLTFTLHYHYQYASKSSVLLVKLVSAQDLPPKDDEEFLDVFVKTQLVPSRKRVYISKVHRDSSNPVFNESYEFDIEYQELQQQKLLFEILDYDCMSRYKPVGEVSVLLAELDGLHSTVVTTPKYDSHISKAKAAPVITSLQAAPEMNASVVYVILIMVLFILFGVLASGILIWKRLQGRFWKKRRRKPTSAELRRFGFPVIDSAPFWVPGRARGLIDVEIQPSPRLGMPVTFSTPKPRRSKVDQDQIPKLKFSVQYHKTSGFLEVQLLDTENFYEDSFEEEFGGNVFLFANVQLTQQEKAKQRSRLMSRRRRRRHTSFEIEMTYEELTLQTLQFCVMGYDVYSRQKVIGDVLLPLAELANQGIDITKELIMWRDIQTCQPRSSLLREEIGNLATVQPSCFPDNSQEEPAGRCTSGQPTETKCSAS